MACSNNGSTNMRVTGGRNPRFVITHGGEEVPATFSAFRDDTANIASVLHYMTVRIPNGEKFRKIIHFYHDLPRVMENKVSGWICTPKTHKFDFHVFVTGVEVGDVTQK